MLADMNTSRARLPIEPSVNPNAVHDVTLTSTITANAGRLDAGGSKSSSNHPLRRPQAETSRPLAITGTPRPLKTANRLADGASKPITDDAGVSAATTRTNGAGAATSTWSVPGQRCHWIAPPDPNNVDDQIPYTAAPSDT